MRGLHFQVGGAPWGKGISFDEGGFKIPISACKCSVSLFATTRLISKHKKTCGEVLLLIKLQADGLQLY